MNSRFNSSPAGRGKGEGAQLTRGLEQTSAGSLPLPLGEGWGEGSAFAEYGGNSGGVTTMHIPSPIASVPFRSANGAASYQPWATPQGCVHSFHQGPTARPIPATIPPGTNRLAVAMGRAFSPRFGLPSVPGALRQAGMAAHLWCWGTRQARDLEQTIAGNVAEILET